MKTFVLVDGNAILHRAFHALPPLNNKEGVLTNAVYGFLSMFLKIIQDLKPEYITICFDRPKPTFRQELYAGYQQHRPKMSDDLVPQVLLVHEVLKKMKASIFEIDGYEADDLIGTLAYQIVKNSKEFEVVVVSGDRDMLQLVNSQVKILMPITGMTKTVLLDSNGVEEKYGIKPLQIIDYKALIGDASDGYPGVTGIGPKTASGLLRKYKTLDNIYQNLGEIPEKMRERLTTDAQQAMLAKKLATIATNAPITLDLRECRVKDLDIGSVRKEFEKLGFKSLLNRLSQVFNEPKNEIKKKTEKKQTDQLTLLNTV